MDQQQQQEQEPQEEEIEINFKLDGEGRTIDTRTNPDQQQEEDSHKEKNGICYQSRTVQTELWAENDTRVEQASALLDELLYDCEISDCGLMPRTFWIDSQNATPRCSLEQMALDIFRHHTGDTPYEPKSSGAEWWVQIRPSPEKVGRYAMHDNKDDDATHDMSKEGISFHWDKDEDLRMLCGGNTYIHPHLSTVTYLTEIGAPTLALNYRVHNLSGDYLVPEKQTQGFLSWPKFGKHLCFDGRYLHAAPADLMEEGAFQKQCQLPKETVTTKAPAVKKLKRRHRRVTFLVNIWLNYKPFGVKPFPDTMIGKLSGHQKDEPKVGIKFKETGDSATQQALVQTEKDEKGLEKFQWPMGDCNSDEFLEAQVPLALARSQASKGGSLNIKWQENTAVRLGRKEKEPENDATTTNSEEHQSKRQKLEGA